MRMADAACEALKTLARPATVVEIYEEIVRQELFTFGAKDPVSVLGKTLRKRTKGSKTLSGEPAFKSPKTGQFDLV